MERKLSTCFSSLGVGSSRSSQIASPGMAAPARNSKRASPWGCGTKALSIGQVCALSLAALLASREIVDELQQLLLAAGLRHAGRIRALHDHRGDAGYVVPRREAHGELYVLGDLGRVIGLVELRLADALFLEEGELQCAGLLVGLCGQGLVALVN